MRRSLILLAAVLVAVAMFTGCRNKPPNIPARPAGLDSLAPNTDGTYLTVTTDPNRDRIRYVFDWGEGATDAGYDTTGYFDSGDTADATHAWADTGWYAVRAKAQDAKGNWSADWSDTHHVHVTIGGGGTNNPPGAPNVPAGPDTGWVGEYQVFQTCATDPNGDSVRIKFLWDDGQTSLWSPLVASGEQVTDSVSYFSRGVKNIRAVAMDKDSAMSDTSGSKFFYANQTNTAPGKPGITGPVKGIKDGPWYRFYGSTVDPEGDSIQYKFFWGDGNVGEWTGFTPSGVISMDSWRYSAEGSYELRVLARDQFGLMSETSDVHSFQVVGEGNILWAIGFDDEIVSSPALGGVLYRGETRPSVIVGITSGFMPAIDCYQGKLLYNANEAENEEFNCSPVIGDDGTVYIGNGNGLLFAYDAGGELKWEWPDTASGDDIAATPAIDGNNLYVGDETGLLVRLTDNGSGASEAWRVQLTEEIIGSPALTGNSLIVADDSGYIYSLRTSDGGENWSYFADSNNITASPAINTDGTIYIGTEQGRLIALNPDGSHKWTYEIWPFATINSSPVITADGTGIIFGADNGMLYRVDASTGQVVNGWPVQVSQAGVPSTPMLCADGYIYVQADDNFLYAIDEVGNIAWSIELMLPAGFGSRGARPRRMAVDDLLPSVVVDEYGIIYVASGLDGIFAIAGRPTGTLAGGPWPMFHHDVRHTGKYGGW